MYYIRYLLVLLAFCAQSNQLAHAHGGGVDDNGGHVDRITGLYHCHNPDCVIAGEHGPQVVSERIRIATFNIKVFGRAKIGKADVMAELAEIARQYDLIAIQEIKDITGRVAPIFRDWINADGSEYDFIISERTGRNPDDYYSQEQYAYFFNTRTVIPVAPGYLFDDSQMDYFQREPFIARFTTVGGSFDFVLINIHTRPVIALSEIANLGHAFDSARQAYPGEADFIALGDFNADCDYASETSLDSLAISQTGYTWIIPHDADTNVSTNTACAYDRMVITSGAHNNFTGDWGIDTVSNGAVSDHFPVWAEFNSLLD